MGLNSGGLITRGYGDNNRIVTRGFGESVSVSGGGPQYFPIPRPRLDRIDKKYLYKVYSPIERSNKRGVKIFSPINKNNKVNIGILNPLLRDNKSKIDIYSPLIVNKDHYIGLSSGFYKERLKHIRVNSKINNKKLLSILSLLED